MTLDQEIFTPADIALLYGLRLNTVYSYIARGKLPARRTLGNYIYFTLTDVKLLKTVIADLREHNKNYFTTSGKGACR